MIIGSHQRTAYQCWAHWDTSGEDAIHLALVGLCVWTAAKPSFPEQSDEVQQLLRHFHSGCSNDPWKRGNLWHSTFTSSVSLMMSKWRQGALFLNLVENSVTAPPLVRLSVFEDDWYSFWIHSLGCRVKSLRLPPDRFRKHLVGLACDSEHKGQRYAFLSSPASSARCGIF